MYSSGPKQSEKSASRSMYRDLLLETLGSDFPDFVKYMQSCKELNTLIGRVAVIHFGEEGQDHVYHIDSACELQNYLNQVPPRASRAHDHVTHRRLFVLEDMDPVIIEILGSALRIPPFFFGAHWMTPGALLDSATHNIVDPGGQLHRNDRYFKVRTIQSHVVDNERIAEKSLSAGMYRDVRSRLPRLLPILDPSRVVQNSVHNQSWWSNGEAYPDEEASWDAVLLVDPIMTDVVLANPPDSQSSCSLHLNHPTTGPSRIRAPRFICMDPLDADIAHWRTSAPTQDPTPNSIFDALLHIHGQSLPNRPAITSDPRTSTAVVRTINYALWTACLSGREDDFRSGHRALVSSVQAKPSRKGFGAGGSWYSAWELEWDVPTFRSLVYQRMAAKNTAKALADIIFTFGIPPSNRVMTTPNEIQTLYPAKPLMLTSSEISQWTALHGRFLALESNLDTWIQGYSAEVAIQESRLSNFQAQSVGRLTALATVLVPVSVVAGIFSMVGDYGAGQPLFWVFWAIVLPLILVLFGLLFGKIWLENKHGKMQFFNK